MQKSDKQPEPEGKVVPVSFGGGVRKLSALRHL